MRKRKRNAQQAQACISGRVYCRHTFPLQFNAIACPRGELAQQSHTPVKQKGDSTSSRSIMTRPGATACRFSTCNTRHHALPLRLLLAEGAGAPPP